MNSLYNRIRKRLYKSVAGLVPHNTHLRPHTICKLHSELEHPNNQEIIPHSIYPNHLTALYITADLYRACSDYWKPLHQVVTDYFVVEVPNGRIHTDNESSIAVISGRNRLVENVSLSLKDGKVTEAGFNSIFEQRYFTKPTEFEGTVFSMLTGGAGLDNISHWFLDVLPRLHLLRESGLYDRVDWFLVPSLRYGYQVETLNLLGIPKEKLIAGDIYPHLTADSIIASTAPRGNHTLVPSWSCGFIRDSFLPYASEETSGAETLPRIYISRSDSKIRKVSNEADLEAELKRLGFQVVISSKLSILEKIQLFSKADTVVSATGAGFINILFCKPGTKIIELFNEGFVIEPFYDIATKIGLDYHYIICEGKRKIRNAAQGQRENLTVDIARVSKKAKDEKGNLKRQKSSSNL